MDLLYEDQIGKAILAQDAAVSGHVLVQPQKQVQQLGQLSEEESSHLFLIASYAAAILFQGLQAEGTNIILNESEEVLTIHIIARKSGDTLDFTWQPATIDAAAMSDAEEKIKEKTFFIGKAEAAPAAEPTTETPPQEDTTEEKLRHAEEEEDLLVQHLKRRIP